jgi:hypothetical protein
VKDELARLRRAVEAAGRAVFARRKAGELEAHILAGPELERRRRRHHHLDDVGRQGVDLGDHASPLDGSGQGVELDLGIA